MNEFEFHGVKYRCAPLDGDVQLGILRRLLPAVLAFGTKSSNIMALYDALMRWKTEGGLPDEKKFDLFSFVEQAAVSMEPVGDKLGRLSDEDTAYIFNHCMAVTSRVGDDGRSYPVRTKTGVISNKDDAKLPVRFTIAWHVVRFDLGSQFQAFIGSVMPEHGGTAE